MRPQLSSEALSVVKVIERDAHPAGECIQAFLRVLLNLADVGRPDAKLTGKSTLRGTLAAVKTRLPDQKLDHRSLTVGAQRGPRKVASTGPTCGLANVVGRRAGPRGGWG